MNVAILLAAAGAAALAYGRRARTLAGRGRPLAAWRPVCFAAGILALLVALAPPVDRLSERLFYVHMVQHLTLGEIAPLLLLLGVTGAAVRPLLALPGARRLRWAASPAVALPFWAANLYGWHFVPGAYELALHNEGVHVVEHGMFFVAGLLMWGALLEPLPGPAWFGNGAKAGYVLVVRALGCAILGNVLIWAGTPLYPSYAGGERAAGIAPLTDQQVGGATMFIWGALITVALFSWAFLRWVREAELRQTLIEGGAEPGAASRTARYARRPPARPAPPPSP